MTTAPPRPAPPNAVRRRVPLWDNARWCAIALVVVGHGILPLIGESDAAYAVYLVVYLFHVPVFVAVSGYFAKSGAPGAVQLRRIVTDLVLPYLLFETVWTLIRWALSGTLTLDYTTASWTLWFLLALTVWRIALPFLVLLRHPLLVAVAVSVLGGYLDSLGTTLALGRIVGFLPFFVFGWALRQSGLTARWLALPSSVAWRWRAGALLLFGGTVVVVASGIDVWREARLRRLLLYDVGYTAAGYPEWWAGALRLGLIGLGVAYTMAFLSLMPRRPVVITPWGAATMDIYLLHSFVLFPVRESGLLGGEQAWWVLPAVVAGCIAIAAVLAQPVVVRVARPLVSPRAAWLFRREPETRTGTLVLPPGGGRSAGGSS